MQLTTHSPSKVLQMEVSQLNEHHTPAAETELVAETSMPVKGKQPSTSAEDVNHSCSHDKLPKKCWDLGRTNSPTSARRGDGLEYIRI